MTQILQFGTFSICAVICLLHIRRYQTEFPLIGLMAGYGVIHGFVPAITPVKFFNQQFATDDARFVAAAYALLCCVAIYFGWCLYHRIPRLRSQPSSDDGKSLMSTETEQSRNQTERKLFVFAALLGGLGICLDLAAIGFDLSTLIGTDRFANRLSRHEVFALMSVYVKVFAFIPPFLGMRLGRGMALWGIVYGVVYAAIEFTITAKGARAIPLGLLMAPCLGYICTAPLKLRSLLVLSGSGLIMLVLSCVLYEVRIAIFPGRTKASPRALEIKRVLTSDPLNYNETLVGAVAHFPEKHPYLDGASYLRILTVAFPRSIFPNLKPPDTHKLFAIQVFGSDPRVLHTIPPSIPGDLYINFRGWPGLLVAVLQGWGFAWLIANANSLRHWQLALLPQYGRLLMLGLRGEPYEMFLIITCSVVLCYLLTKLVCHPALPASNSVEQADFKLSKAA